MSDYDRSIHSNPDARAWAREFIRTINEHPEVPTDEGAMIGWFANAMMAMHDHVKRTGAEEVRREAMEEAARAVDALSDADAYATQSGALMDAAAAIRALATGERKEADDA